MGIGKASCILLAEEGTKVVVANILDKEGQKVTEEIKKAGAVAEFWHLDVSNEKEVKKVFAGIDKKFREIYILVNNAGIVGVSKNTHEITEEE